MWAHRMQRKLSLMIEPIKNLAVGLLVVGSVLAMVALFGIGIWALSLIVSVGMIATVGFVLIMSLISLWAIYDVGKDIRDERRDWKC